MDHRLNVQRHPKPSRARRFWPACRSVGVLAASSTALVINVIAAGAFENNGPFPVEQPASGQPGQARPSSHDTIPPTAADALRRLGASYRSSPIGERVYLTLNDAPAPDTDHGVLVRVFAGVAPSRQDRIVRIDLPDLSVCVLPGRVVATRPSDPTGFLEWPIEGTPTLTALESVLPPLALPQLALALGDEALGRPTPFGTVDSWEIKPPERPDLGTLVRLIGTGPATITEIVFDALTDRIAEFTIKPAPARSGATVHGRCEAVAPGPTKSWLLSVEGRRRAQSFEDLRPPPSELKVGDVLPEVSFQDREQARWSLASSLANASNGDLGLILLFRPATSGDGAISADVATGIGSMQQAWRRAVLKHAERQSGPTTAQRAPEVKLVFARGVAVFDLEAFTRERLERLHGTWAASVSTTATDLKSDVRPPPELSSLLWTPTGVGSLDRLAPDARALLVVLGADRTIRALVRLDGRASDEAALNAELEAVAH